MKSHVAGILGEGIDHHDQNRHIQKQVDQQHDQNGPYALFMHFGLFRHVLSSLCQVIQAADARIQPQHHQREHNQQHREGCAQRPVPGHQKLVLNQISEINRIASAHDVRNKEGAEAWNEHLDCAGEDSGECCRENDTKKGSQRTCSKIHGSLDKAVVQLGDAGMQGEYHKRNHTIHHTEKNGPIGVHHGDRMLDDPCLQKQGVDDAAVSQDIAPAVKPQQSTDPEGQNDQQHQNAAEPLRDLAQKPGEGIRNKETDDAGLKGHEQRFPGDF